MSSYIGSFARMEKKYVLNRDEMRRFLCAISSKIEEDEYPRSTINSIYFDTEDNKLINKSQEKPYYKEKLRLRTYTGIVHEQTEAFAEIKKKVNGIVYKRRTAGEYGSLFKWLCGTTEAPDSEQITREIAYLLQFYGQMRPSMQIVYRRESYVAVEDHDLRITFDTDVIWRNWSLETDGNAYGFRLLPEETVLMEVKASGKTIPLWLVREIEKHDIRPSSISKYG
ncbi:MAG: polyphosphate polymerase domain-containing protein, partial [Oscillospiraceae bacterium]|nr:polyphosphate polymerase domain-containing protein [Oscillospiraceae bacterium]